jgi:Protein of unknown function (DUF3800)
VEGVSCLYLVHADVHLLYLDDSGSVADPAQNYFVLGGISMFERQTHWMERELATVAKRFEKNPSTPIELHGSPMYNGRGEWRAFPLADRINAIKDALCIARDAQQSIRLFAVAVHKRAIGPEDPVEYAFEQICHRFDKHLKRLHHNGNTQRGLIVCDKSTKETALQTLAREFKSVGHRWGVLHNLAEVPVFIDSRASRLVQIADLIAWSVFRACERNDKRFIGVIEQRFDTVGGVCHGLLHMPDPATSSPIVIAPLPLATPPAMPSLAPSSN